MLAGEHAAHIEMGEWKKGLAMPMRFVKPCVLGGAVVLAVVVFAAGAGDDDAATKQRALRVVEAQAIVRVYEIKLHNAKIRADQEDVKWANVNDTFESLQKAHTQGAVPDKVYRESKEQYDWWKLQDQVQDWQEIEAELAIARVRVQMVESGLHVYEGNTP